MKKIKIDLHDIFNKGQEIDRVLSEALDEAVSKRAKILEIIPGKGSGQLKKRVIRFLEKNKDRYKRIDKDSKNWGRIFVRF